MVLGAPDYVFVYCVRTDLPRNVMLPRGPTLVVVKAAAVAGGGSAATAPIVEHELTPAGPASRLVHLRLDAARLSSSRGAHVYGGSRGPRWSAASPRTPTVAGPMA